MAQSEQFTHFVRKYAEGFAKRHCDESLASLDGERSVPVLERAFGTSARRAERIADRESVQAGNAFAKALYREAGVQTFRWVLGDEREECRQQDGQIFTDGSKFTHPPLGDGCECVLEAVVTRPELRTAVRDMDGRPAPPPTITVPITIAEGAIRVDAPEQMDSEIVYHKTGPLKGAVKGTRKVQRLDD